MSSDIGDDFKFLKEVKREKKQRNQQSSTEILRDRGIKFTSFNGGNHLVVKNIDFWPSTGKWIVRGGKTGRGVFPLLEEIERLGGHW